MSSEFPSSETLVTQPSCERKALLNPFIAGPEIRGHFFAVEDSDGRGRELQLRLLLFSAKIVRRRRTEPLIAPPFSTGRQPTGIPRRFGPRPRPPCRTGRRSRARSRGAGAARPARRRSRRTGTRSGPESSPRARSLTGSHRRSPISGTRKVLLCCLQCLRESPCSLSKTTGTPARRSSR